MEDIKVGQEVSFKWPYQKNHSITLTGIVRDIETGDIFIVEVVDLEGKIHNFHVMKEYIQA